jgi:hypothetical protein
VQIVLTYEVGVAVAEFKFSSAWVGVGGSNQRIGACKLITDPSYGGSIVNLPDAYTGVDCRERQSCSNDRKTHA